MSGRVLIDLAHATGATCGGKAAPLARLLAAGIDVPPGFVVPVRAYRDAVAGIDFAGADRRGEDVQRLVLDQAALTPYLVEEIAGALTRITGSTAGGHVAVRSSATTEDGPHSAAAGQHESVLGVRGPRQVAGAVLTCWASLWSKRAVEYRRHQPDQQHGEPPGMAVVVQALVDPEVAGVMFTGATTRIEASWGLGSSIVAGHVTPDSWAVTADAVTSRTLGTKAVRTDRADAGVRTRDVPEVERDRWCLSEEQALRLAHLGRQVEVLLGEPQDVEWAIAGDRLWLLQARPITATLPTGRAAPPHPRQGGTVLRGTPASQGQALGPARVLHGPDDFNRLRRGDVLVCAATDPAWTPLFALASAVVTESGGLLCHAAIIAREQNLPAVLALPGATTTLIDGDPIHVNGSTGHVMITVRRPSTVDLTEPPPDR